MSDDTDSNGSDEESMTDEEPLAAIMNETDDEDADTGNYFWYVVYQTCEINDDKHFLEACTGYLDLYVRSKDDVLFQNIMDDTAKFEVAGMKFEEALGVAILRHKQAITVKVNNCKNSGTENDEHEIWCEFARQDAKPWCRWFTGETCVCNDCDNSSMPKMVGWFAYIFHLIEEDDLTLEIADKLEECQDLYHELIPTLESYRKDIMEKYTLVKDLVYKPKPPRTLVSLFNYIDENE